MLTKPQILAYLSDTKYGPHAIGKALVVLFKNQTASEQSQEATINRNGEGFRPCHAHMGTSMARFYAARGFLTPKQIDYWRRPMKDGNMRIGVYWRQLAEAAEVKARRVSGPMYQGKPADDPTASVTIKSAWLADQPDLRAEYLHQTGRA